MFAAPRKYIPIILALSLTALCVTNVNAQSQPASTPTPDEILWQEVQSALADVQDTPPYAADVDVALAPRRLLLEKTRLYLTAYPGGRRRDAAIRRELKTLFEIGVLSGGRFDDLEAQTRIYLERPPSRQALQEAAYWKIRCEYMNHAAAQPTAAPVPRHDPLLLQAYRAYVAEYPRSPYVPRMTVELFQAADDARDLPTMRRLAENLDRYFPDHLMTRNLRASLNREDAVGQIFTLKLTLIDGAEFNLADWRGSTVLIVVWAAFDDDALRTASEIEQFRVKNPSLKVIGVNIDPELDAVTKACESLDLAWPQACDKLGWAGEFVRKWGIREIPLVLAVASDGRLAGWSRADRWRDLAANTLGN